MVGALLGEVKAGEGPCVSAWAATVFAKVKKAAPGGRLQLSDHVRANVVYFG